MSKTVTTMKGLPANVDAERFLIGSILTDSMRMDEVAGSITAETFSLERHRRIWQRMSDIVERGERADWVTLTNELTKYGELESVGGMSFLVSLNDDLPQIPSLTGYVQILIEKQRLRQLAMSAQNTMNRALMAQDSPDDIQTAAIASLSESLGFGSTNAETVDSFVRNFPGGINTLLDPSKWEPGVTTGFKRLDEMTGGFHASEIFMVAARPGHGKTSFLSSVVKNVARTGLPVLVITLELQKQMFLNRMFCEEAYISYRRFVDGGLSEAERLRLRFAVTEIMGMPLYVDSGTGMTMADIRVKVNSVIRQTSQRPLVGIDYAQLIRGPKGKRFNSENDKFTDIGEDLKKLANDTGCPMLLLSQLNRESEKVKGDNRPKISQARGAGIWEELAFVGACLYREVKSKPARNDLRNVAELILEKNRSGEDGTIPLKFEGWAMRFSDADDVAPAPPDETGG